MKSVKTVLTGIKPTGQPHIGNYLGAMRPALSLSAPEDVRSLLFIADYHSLTSVHKGDRVHEMTYEVAAAWLACGLDPEKTIIYKQSDIPEILVLAWILSCFTPKGFMNRAHAYKAHVAENDRKGSKDPDAGISMGLYSYPVLMSADILLFDTDRVPVGEDQIQHIEFARDIAKKLNHNYGEVLKLPEPVIQRDVKVVYGLDGQKMSKSYNNHIPMFLNHKKLRQMVMKIKTDSSLPEEPKDPDTSLLMDLYKEFATDEETHSMRERYGQGIGWGGVKQSLFEVIDREVAPARDKYHWLMDNRSEIDEILKTGAKKARAIAVPVMDRVKQAVGVCR